MSYKLSEVADSLSFPAFAERALRIITMQGQLAWLRLNLPQRKVHSILLKQEEAGFPMRAIILKARREGVSTLVEARYFREINRRQMRYACVCSADTDATDKVFKMTSLFQQEIPPDLKRPTDYSNRKEIIYSAPHRSQFLCQTAGKDVLGRGGLTHYLHATEFSFWAKAKEQLGGAVQEVPDDPGTIIVVESTANGTGGAFYDMFVEAVDRYKSRHDLDTYLPIFLPWFIFPAYCKAVTPDWSATADELELQRQFNLNEEQLCWRRWAIENKCQGDVNMFKQEYPGTWLEAFQSSGQPVFSPEILKFQERHVRDDIRYGLFDPRTGDFMPHPGSTYGWQVLDGPGSEEHVIGADTTEHRLTDEKDSRSERDFDGVIVMGRKSAGKQVKAIWHGRGPQNVLGEQILGAAKHYNNAWVVIEIPQGMGAMQVLVDAGYPNIYSRQTKQTQYTPEDSPELGYRTTTVTRHWLVNDLISALRADGIICQFQVILDQIRTFIYDKTGKPIHMPGKHDDLIFGLGLALQGDLHCPRNLSLEIPEYTGEETVSGRPEPSDYDLCTSGAYDDKDAEDEDDDDGWYETV